AMTVMTFNGKTFEVDDDIADLVHALNTAGIATVASCSGHGMRPGRISLADGRELFVLPSYEIAQWFDTQFPRDINGQTADEREERDELAKDADRYRWLRDREIPEWLDLWHQNPDRIDAAIDDLRQGDQP